METLTYSKARQKLAKTMDRACSNHEPILVTRQKSQSVVIMSLEDYELLEETAYLLRTPQNASRLIEAISELESGKGTVPLSPTNP